MELQQRTGSDPGEMAPGGRSDLFFFTKFRPADISDALGHAGLT